MATLQVDQVPVHVLQLNFENREAVHPAFHGIAFTSAHVPVDCPTVAHVHWDFREDVSLSLWADGVVVAEAGGVDTNLVTAAEVHKGAFGGCKLVPSRSETEQPVHRAHVHRRISAEPSSADVLVWRDLEVSVAQIDLVRPRHRSGGRAFSGAHASN